MGQDFSREYPSTWKDADVIEWKKKARAALKNYYLGYEGVQWHEYSSEDIPLLTTKICFALYGPPTQVGSIDTNLEDTYRGSQRETANKITNKIIEVYKKCPATQLRVGIIFISCKNEEEEFLLPIFRVYVGDNEGELSEYIDVNCRVYKNWTDWRENNNLPMLKYCYPSKGCYTCSSDCSYEFDPEKEPDVHFGTSPACDFSARVGRQFDIVGTVTSLGGGTVAIIGMFTPLAPVIAVGSAIAGTTAALYGTGRSIHRLVDKGSHGESLTDLESFACWLSIILTPAHLTASFTNGILTSGARNSGRIFSSTFRTAATIINCTTFGLDSMMFVFGLANLIEKAQNHQLNALDVLQFSMSIFFFTHTLLQSKTAAGIITTAQNEHISAYKNSMSDPETQQAFQNFVDQNRGNNGMVDNSKIVRTINRIHDPDTFFHNTRDMTIKIGGRKGRSVILNNDRDPWQRVNPNRDFQNPSVQATVTTTTSHSGVHQFEYGSVNTEDMEPIRYGVEIEMNSRNIKFSQSTVNDPNSITGLKFGMFCDGWVGGPIDIVETSPGEYVSLDNRRLLAAKWNDIKVKAIVHRGTDQLPDNQIRRFSLPRQDQIPLGQRIQYTYNDAVDQRIRNQPDGFQPTTNLPEVICRPGETEEFY